MNKTTILSFLFLWISTTLFAQKLPLSPEVVIGKLENGLTYYIYPNDYPKKEATYRLFIKSGSVFENNDQRGLAHFLEHLAFNGTTHFADNELVKFLESKGAKFGKDINAHTSFSETVYKLQLPTKENSFVDTTLTILADWAGGLLLDSTEIEKERGVIISEFISKAGPKKEMQNTFILELLNGSHYAERLTIGDTNVVRNSSREKIYNYYKNWYRPDLMAVSVVGDVDVKQVENLIKQKFSDLTPPKSIVPHYTIPPYKEEKLITYTHHSLDNIELNAMQLMPQFKAVQTSKDYGKYLELSILNRLIKSRLSALSFENPPYKNGQYNFSNFLNVTGVGLAAVQLIPNKIEEGIISFATDIEQIARYGFTAFEINKAKKIIINELKRKTIAKSPVESVKLMDETYSHFYNKNAIITPETEYKEAQKWINKIDSVSLVKLLHKLHKPTQTHYMLTAFDKVKEELPTQEKLLSILATIRKNPLDRYTKSLYVPDRLLEETPIEGSIIKERQISEIDAIEWQLSNGATVIYKNLPSDKNRILISGFRKGGLYALDSTRFVSGIFAGNIIPLSGAGSFSREALSAFLAGNTASVQFLLDKTRTGIIGSANNLNKESLFQLLHLKWTKANLDTAVYNQVKNRSIEKYRTTNKTDADRYYQELNYLIQGRNYSNREMTDTLINNELKIEELLPIFNDSFGKAKGYTFTVLTDMPADSVKPLVTAYIASLPAGETETTYQYKRTPSIRSPFDFERKASDSPKATVMLTFPNDTLPLTLDLFNIKGDIMRSILRTKLMNTMREKMGLVYSVGVDISAAQQPTPVMRSSINFTCASTDANLLITTAIDEIKKAIATPSLMEVELAAVKKNMQKANEINRQKSSYWSSTIRNNQFNEYNNNWNNVAQYDKIVSETSCEEIAALIKYCFIETPMVKSILYPKDTVNKKP